MASTGVEVPYKGSIGRNPSVREFDTIINAGGLHENNRTPQIRARWQ